jgi:hypothetical protein
MAQASVAHRRTSARQAAARRRDRRSKVLAIVLTVVLAGLLAFQLPRIFKRLNGESSTTASPASTLTPTSPRSGPKKIPAILRGTGSGADPFSLQSLPDGDSRIGPGGGRDPFASRLGGTSVASTPVVALPKRLVIGTPGAHKRLIHGWIVILASIPVRYGHEQAVKFARNVTGLGSVAILNSSKRRPLRGGYWVVYVGPVKTLSAVGRLAGSVHAAGYRTAYIRELYQYR